MVFSLLVSCGLTPILISWASIDAVGLILGHVYAQLKPRLSGQISATQRNNEWREREGAGTEEGTLPSKPD